MTTVCEGPNHGYLVEFRPFGGGGREGIERRLAVVGPGRFSIEQPIL